MAVKKKGEAPNNLPPELVGGEDSELRPAGLDRKTELELIDAALLGDMQPFAELFKHYRSDLHGLCTRRLDDPSLAEDVVQEVFIRAFENLSSFNRDKPIWPWLATIANRMCVDLQRHRSLTQYFADLGAAVDEDAEVHGRARSALDEVMASEDRAELWRAVRVLPKRQRRALLLYALNGMSYADIAAAEGISIGAVELLIVRARRKMRAERQNGSLPAIVSPFNWLRWKLQQMEERLRPLLGVYGDGWASACVQAACLVTVVAMVVATNRPVYSLERDDSISSNQTIVTSTQSESLIALANNVLPAKAAVNAPQSSEPQKSSLDLEEINPIESATPEETKISSIMASPNYENDHTILAGGYHSPQHVLFVSRDGGANWKLLPARSLLGSNMLLSPAFQHDRRVFALAPELGLQQSEDGGEIFRVASPMLAGSLAISPLFGRGDYKISVGQATLLEYEPGTGLTRLSSLPIPLSRWGYSSITYSPGYPSDPTIFIFEDYFFDSVHRYRCKELVCDEMHLPVSEKLHLRLSPRFHQDSFAYAFTYTKLLVSYDGVRTIRDLQFPLPDSGTIHDVAIMWQASSEPSIFAYVVERKRSSVYRSLDAGRTWSSSRIEVPGFDYGGGKLIVTPTGRLLATATNGIACSDDGGQNWSARCPPE